MSDYLNRLPNELLLHTFDRLPLYDLLRLDQVCPKWKELLPRARASRRTLVLIIGGLRVGEMRFTIPFNDTNEVSYDGRRPYYDLPAVEREASITFPSLFMPIQAILLDGPRRLSGRLSTELARLHDARLSGQLDNYLTDLFPNVHNLVLIHPRCDGFEFSLVLSLLGKWSLKTLKVWIRTAGIDERWVDGPERHSIFTVPCMVNCHHALRQLTLDIDGDGPNRYTFLRAAYAFIGRLNSLKIFLGRYDRDDAIWDIVRHFDHPGLRHIALGNEEARLVDVLNPRLDYTAKVCQIYPSLSCETTANFFRQFCTRFASLTSVGILWSYHITFAQLVTNLATLEQLSQLGLCFHFDNLPVNPFAMLDRVDGEDEDGDEEGEDGDEEDEDGDEEEGENGDEEDEEEPRPPLPSLPQVTVLKLNFWPLSHNDFESLSPLVFPSVEVIIVEAEQDSDCTICRPNNNGLQDFGEWDEPCHRRLIRSLKNRFANPLARIYVQGQHFGEYVDWTNGGPNEDGDDDVIEIDENDDEVEWIDVDEDDENNQPEQV